MNKSSYFIKDIALFGGYPNEEDIIYYESIGVKYIVNLTHENDNLKPYYTNCIVIKYPILDIKIPKDVVTFSSLILKLDNILHNLQKNEKIYVHCKGGHGRAGILVASLLCYNLKITPEESLQLTNNYHSKRIEMKDKWRNIGSPQTTTQKKFVHKLFNPFYFSRCTNNGSKHGFSNLSDHEIIINNLSYKNAEIAYQSFSNEKVININTKNIYYIKHYYESKKTLTVNEKINLMKSILFEKFKQHPDIKDNLIRTALRPINYLNPSDTFWGINKENNGTNHIGQILYNIKIDILNHMNIN
jgi:predicted NAD-dependent protein-ADP-ribosyltransferase YbiA (DUF1768 family)